MSLSRAEAVEESDRRWPDFGDLVGHALSGGFVDGALWRDQNPEGELLDQIEKVLPHSDDPYEEVVRFRWRKGYAQGANWAARRAATESTDITEEKN